MVSGVLLAGDTGSGCQLAGDSVGGTPIAGVGGEDRSYSLSAGM
jgi:hypothetical protein